MIEGTVNAAHEAVLTLSLEGPTGRLQAKQHLERGTAYRQLGPL